MRNLTKGVIPNVLDENQDSWTASYIADKSNSTKKFRYRHKDIKCALKNETGSKCIYCESKIGHNTPGDVEHKIPSTADENLHFAWDNLTIACTECNRRKSNYNETDAPFLDPYADDVEDRVVHLGPLLSWRPGDNSAEISIRILEMHDATRFELIKKKVEAIDKLNNLISRINREQGALKEMLLISLEKMKDRNAEYSAMINSTCEKYGL